jgi:hypothetical protein
MPKVVIISRREGFRRCGEAHSVKETIWETDHFSEEQVKILEAEPMLIVGYLEDEDGTSEAEPVPTKPENTDDLLAAIAKAIGDLDKETDFTKAGTPRVDSVEAKLGYNVNGEEVLVAFEQYKKDNG